MEPHFWFGAFVSVNTLLIALLAMNVSRVRIREKIANGDGGNVALKKAIRAHGNSVEHLIPVGLQMAALELCHAPTEVLLGLGAAFTFFRILHALSMLGAIFRLRQLAALGTYASELSGAVAVFIVSLSA